METQMDIQMEVPGSFMLIMYVPATNLPVLWTQLGDIPWDHYCRIEVIWRRLTDEFPSSVAFGTPPLGNVKLPGVNLAFHFYEPSWLSRDKPSSSMLFARQLANSGVGEAANLFRSVLIGMRHVWASHPLTE